MLEKISDVPGRVLGFRASGELIGDDYRAVLVPAVEAALRSRDKLRLLYLLGDDVTGFSAGAAWQDAKVGMEHATRWEKIAVVTHGVCARTRGTHREPGPANQLIRAPLCDV